MAADARSRLRDIPLMLAKVRQLVSDDKKTAALAQLAIAIAELESIETVLTNATHVNTV